MRIHRVLGAVVLATSVSVSGVTLGATAARAMHSDPQAIAAPAVVAGRACRSADVGEVVMTASGRQVTCSREGKALRWVVV